MIEVQNLTRDFVVSQKVSFLRSKKKTIHALDNISFEIPEGEIFGFLGPNGAGKTTTIKILCTLLYPTSGNAKIGGYDIVKQSNQVRKIINMTAGGERMLYFRLTGRENLLYFADLYNVSKNRIKDKIDDLLAIVGLSNRADEKVENYSKGMKQRLQIARALINDPKVLFLDEPTLGLDPEVAYDIRQFIKTQVQKEKITIFLTSHYLFEIEDLANRIGIINKGKLLIVDTPKAIRKNSQIQIIAKITVDKLDSLILDKMKSIEQIDSITSQQSTTTILGRSQLIDIIIKTKNEENINQCIDLLLREHKTIYSISINEPSLEEAFLKLIREEP